MNELDGFRAEIDRIDTELARAFWSCGSICVKKSGDISA